MSICKKIITFCLTCTILSSFTLPSVAEAQAVSLPQNKLSELLELNHPMLQFTRTPPSETMALPQNAEYYLLRTGDQLEIYIWNQRLNLNYVVTIQPDGRIVLPKMEPLYVQGFKVSDVLNRLKQRLKTNYSDPINVSLNLKSIRPIEIMVSGFVEKPGQYSLPWGTPLLEALRKAGGIKNNGSLRQIQKKSGQKMEIIDLFAFYYKGQTQSNPHLTENLSIHIPALKERIALIGEIYTPGLYELRQGESLSTYLTLAGGKKPSADPENFLRWERGLDQNRGDFLNFKSEDLPLHNGDILYFQPRITPTGKETLYIYGQIQNPGIQVYQKGLTLQECIKLAGGPLTNADLSQIKLSREIAGERQVIDLNYQGFLQGENRLGEFQLQPGDVIIIPESFFNIKNITELTTLVLSVLGIISVVINMSTRP